MGYKTELIDAFMCLYYFIGQQGGVKRLVFIPTGKILCGDVEWNFLNGRYQ